MAIFHDVMSLMHYHKIDTIPYKKQDGTDGVLSAEHFAYILNQADPFNMSYLNVLSAFNNREKLIEFAGKLVEKINDRINKDEFYVLIPKEEEIGLFNTEE